MSVAAFFDIDGTLVYHPDKKGTKAGDAADRLPTPRVQDAIRRFVANGHRAFLSTGRGMHSVEPDIINLGFTGAISMNGARAELDGRMLRSLQLSPEQVEAMAREAERAELSIVFEGPNETCILEREGFDPFYPSPKATDFEGVRRAVPSLEFTKIIFDASQLDRYRQSRYLVENYDHFDCGTAFHELVLPGVDKGVAVADIIDALPERPERVLGFGDSENDLGMLLAVDVGIAMATSPPKVLEAADIVCEGAAEDGVALELERLGLI